jgi:hypothetical protein
MDERIQIMAGFDRSDVIDILMNRDGMSLMDATDLVAEAQMEIDALMGTGVEGMAGVCDAEQIIMDYFGLEPDYLMDFIPVC